MKGQREGTTPPSFDEIKFKAPFICIISGPSGSGKSSFCIRLLQNLKFLCTESRFDGGIIWFYSEKTTVPSHLGENVRFNEGVPDNF
jgi:ABC-type phosphate transport system ATPase subunit